MAESFSCFYCNARSQPQEFVTYHDLEDHVHDCHDSTDSDSESDVRVSPTKKVIKVMKKSDVSKVENGERDSHSGEETDVDTVSEVCLDDDRDEDFVMEEDESEEEAAKSRAKLKSKSKGKSNSKSKCKSKSIVKKKNFVYKKRGNGKQVTLLLFMVQKKGVKFCHRALIIVLWYVSIFNVKVYQRNVK